ncbi:hypothetical protein ES703_90573 [subsurface metagenome]
MEDAVKVAFQVCLVLFSVLLGWAIYNVLDQYPCIHRFGRIWGEDRKSVTKDRRIILSCWFSLIFIVTWCVFSLSRTYELFGKFSTHYSDARIILYSILGLFSFIYFFLPYLINRFLWGLAIFVAPTDFKAYVDDQEKKERWLTKRFSEETISTIYKRPLFCAGVITVNTGLLLALLILCPCFFLRFWCFFKASPLWTFVILGLMVVFSLIFYIPYSRWVR